MLKDTISTNNPVTWFSFKSISVAKSEAKRGAIIVTSHSHKSKVKMHTDSIGTYLSFQ